MTFLGTKNELHFCSIFIIINPTLPLDFFMNLPVDENEK